MSKIFVIDTNDIPHEVSNHKMCLQLGSQDEFCKSYSGCSDDDVVIYDFSKSYHTCEILFKSTDIEVSKHIIDSIINSLKKKKDIEEQIRAVKKIKGTEDILERLQEEKRNYFEIKIKDLVS